ncbi:MAG: hypothetical protein AABY22_17845 [Nanoarchaeota archaeon]
MRLFNFNIPEELYEYLKKYAKEEYTDMSKYLIQLIVKDKKEKIKIYGKNKK